MQQKSIKFSATLHENFEFPLFCISNSSSLAVTALIFQNQANSSGYSAFYNIRQDLEK